MSVSQQINLDFKDLTLEKKVKLLLKLKPYIQPFEQFLAQGELYGLLGDDYTERPFSNPAKLQVTISTSTTPELLRGRLAYWEQVGTCKLQPTLQVLLESEKPIEELPIGADFQFHRSRKLRYGPHGIHEYRGKFFPQLVKSLVNFAGLRPGAVVLDPMCGSGTTGCEARSMGMKSLGVDLNPLSVKISRVKSSVLDMVESSLKMHVESALSSLQKAKIQYTESEFPWNEHDERYLKRWFAPAALQELSVILDTIKACPDSMTEEFLEICFSNVLRPVSWQKDSDLRVRKKIVNYVPGTAVRLFSEEAQRNLDKVLSYLSCFSGDFEFPEFVITEGDSRNIEEVLPDWVGKCDLLVTSPPYATALPYIDTDRLSLTVLNLLPRADHRARELVMIGNREITDSERQELWEQYLRRRKELPKCVRDTIEKIDLANKSEKVGFRRKNLSALLGRYFLDMADAMGSALRMVKPGSYAFYVVGNNSTTINGGRMDIETDRFLWEIGKKVGWKQKKIINMELLPSRDIFRNKRGSAESILWFAAESKGGVGRKAIYGTTSGQAHKLNNGEWDFHDEDTQQHLHALHPYPARFIPQIPRKAISEWSSSDDVVLEPFCGCGTTLLESIILGREAIGVDNNAVACLVSRAKVIPYSPNEIKALGEFAENLRHVLAEVSSIVSLPDYHNVSYWFDVEALKDLAKLRVAINQLPENAKVFALAVFSSIIVRVSNQDSDTRYARIERPYKPGDAVKWFKTRLTDAINRLWEIKDVSKARATVYCADSRNLDFIPDESVHLIVTSPPYLNAYDYHKYHRHRIHWIDGDVSLARDTEIGKHDTFTRPKATPNRYFEDMRQCFTEWKRVLVPGGKAFIVIGDGIVSKKPVAVGDMFVEIMKNLGIEPTDRWIRNLQMTRKSFNQNTRINKEHLLLFTKP